MVLMVHLDLDQSIFWEVDLERHSKWLGTRSVGFTLTSDSDTATGAGLPTLLLPTPARYVAPPSAHGVPRRST